MRFKLTLATLIGLLPVLPVVAQEQSSSFNAATQPKAAPANGAALGSIQQRLQRRNLMNSPVERGLEQMKIRTSTFSGQRPPLRTLPGTLPTGAAQQPGAKFIDVVNGAGQSSTGAPGAKPLFKSGELEKALGNKAHQYRMQTPGFVDHPRDQPKPGEVTTVQDALKRRAQERQSGQQ